MIPKELMDQLRYIEIRTLRAAQEYRRGEYRSLFRGYGFEFEQHKRYQYGDDYRRIDWNVTARMNHPYVKKGFEEKELTAIIMADLSPSMEFSTCAQSKREMLVQIATVLAFSASCDNMNVGLLAFTEKIEVDFTPKKGRAQIWKILESLWDVKPKGSKTDFSCPFGHLMARLKRPSLLFCISDFITSEDIFSSHSFKELIYRHDFIPLIILDNWDEALPGGKGFIRLRDAEADEEMLFRLSGRNTGLYERLMKERKVSLQRSLYHLNLDHLFLKVGEPFLSSILDFSLARRRQH